MRRQGASDPAIKALGALLADYLESRCVPLYEAAIAKGQIPPAVVEEIDGLVDGAAAANVSSKVTHKVEKKSPSLDQEKKRRESASLWSDLKRKEA